MKKLTLLGILLYYTTDIPNRLPRRPRGTLRHRPATGKSVPPYRQHLLLRGRYRLV